MAPRWLTNICELYPATERIILTGYSKVALAALATPAAGQRTLSKASDGVRLKDTLERLFESQDARIDKGTGAAARSDEASAMTLVRADSMEVARHSSGISISQMSGVKGGRIRQFLQGIESTWVRVLSLPALAMRPIRHASNGNASSSDGRHSATEFQTETKVSAKEQELYLKEDFFGPKNYSSTLNSFGPKVENFGTREYSRRLGRFVSRDKQR